jgi:phenylpyruvate tautomerase PptA (4-oxalocrotonate tautomerase family)
MGRCIAHARSDERMAQIRIYGRRDHLSRARAGLSDAIHGCMMEALGLPADKRFHRFVGLDAADFIYPPDRDARYTIVEISMFEGRAVETKRRLIRLLFERLEAECGIAPGDVEITIFETPRHTWGIRGLPADELSLNYTVET